MEGAESLVVEGYWVCRRCGDWTVKGTGLESLKLCTACSGDLATLSREQRIRYEVEGKIFTTIPKAPRKKKRNRTKAAADYHRLWNRARSRAIARLVQIDKPLFELLMAEEKERVGLAGGYNSHHPRDAETTRAVIERIEGADLPQG